MQALYFRVAQREAGNNQGKKKRKAEGLTHLSWSTSSPRLAGRPIPTGPQARR